MCCPFSLKSRLYNYKKYITVSTSQHVEVSDKFETVPLSSILLGNVIKAILHDFEGVKKSISSKAVTSIATFRAKVRRDIESARLETEFPTEIVDIVRKLRGLITSEEQNVIENQVQFLKFMINLKEIIKQAQSVTSRTVHRARYLLESDASSDDPEIQLMNTELRDLLQWVMKKRDRFSEQELDDFNEELHRARLMLSYLALTLEIRKKNTTLDKEAKYLAFLKKTLEAGTKLSK